MVELTKVTKVNLVQTLRDIFRPGLKHRAH